MSNKGNTPSRRRTAEWMVYCLFGRRGWWADRKVWIWPGWGHCLPAEVVMRRCCAALRGGRSRRGSPREKGGGGEEEERTWLCMRISSKGTECISPVWLRFNIPLLTPKVHVRVPVHTYIYTHTRVWKAEIAPRRRCVFVFVGGRDTSGRAIVPAITHAEPSRVVGSARLCPPPPRDKAPPDPFRLRSLINLQIYSHHCGALMKHKSSKFLAPHSPPATTPIRTPPSNPPSVDVTRWNALVPVFGWKNQWVADLNRPTAASSRCFCSRCCYAVSADVNCTSNTSPHCQNLLFTLPNAGADPTGAQQDFAFKLPDAASFFTCYRYLKFYQGFSGGICWYSYFHTWFCLLGISEQTFGCPLFAVFAAFPFHNFWLCSPYRRHCEEMNSLASKIYLGTPANVDLMIWENCLTNIKYLWDFILYIYIFFILLSHHVFVPAKLQSEAGGLSRASRGPFVAPRRQQTPDRGWKCLSPGYYLKHDEVSEVLKARRWWSKHKTWMQYSLSCERAVVGVVVVAGAE